MAKSNLCVANSAFLLIFETFYDPDTPLSPLDKKVVRKGKNKYTFNFTGLSDTINNSCEAALTKDEVLSTASHSDSSNVRKRGLRARSTAIRDG
ncbi:hypothetical protein GWI33_000137 [Rhynchophorus ferrugineus]|uniref:Uncharacterized protein n=1 Tax=Rhynchophorus ferrugineus TaxID=354439 RepID=A0A834IVM7_RHYFE|nr:hypothetical protein GWI33_000137 [Rhynchophorus ferrugineus]